MTGGAGGHMPIVGGTIFGMAFARRVKQTNSGMD